MSEKDVFLEPDYVRFYDWTYEGYEPDLEFYRDLVRQSGSPVLEVACGTGRVAIPLAREGAEVVGIDLSEPMLDIARAKLAKEPPAVQKRVSFIQADMKDFDLGRQFAAVFVPHAAVFHLQGRLSLSHCFRSLYRHTRPGGLAVVDVWAPRHMADQPIGKKATVKEGVNPATGLLTRELNQKLGINWDTQTVRVEHTYVEVDGDEEKEHVFVQDYRWLEKDEGARLLERAGFPEIRTLGDYDRQKFTALSPRLILVARRLERDVL
ncbi:MAG: class I SAM-dependent methyltransferase [Planctomycetota bacterium]|jgi:SAM-dependent methyltransferase